jgi:pimeloyl-ACP methyl ester carboxylesterase
MVNHFIANIPNEILDDLKSRIRNTRLPDEIIDSGWSYGSSLTYMKELADFWLNNFDWRKVEAEINSYPNFTALIDGYKIHFLHIKGNGKNSIPLIITHGWPGSFIEMLKLIPLLTTDEDFSFDLVIPSLMGYGFSQKITSPRCDIHFMGELWYKLMKELGYDNFGAHGGDFGSGVSMVLALKYPKNVIGLHLNNIEGYYSPYLPKGEIFTQEEIRFEKDAADWYDKEGAYSHQQKTKALTLAYGLNDSPIGLCAWIIEKFYSWADCKGNLENVFSKNELLANVTLYWVTETLHSSIRLYHESRKLPLNFQKDDFVNVPVGIIRFPLEDPFPPRKYIERGFNIQRWTEMPSGGHFAAMEKPNLLAKDIKYFFMQISNYDS